MTLLVHPQKPLKMAAATRRNPMVSASNCSDADDRWPDVDALAATVRACQLGDRGAQQRLYEACHERVYRLTVRMVGLQDAADVTQNVFLQLYRKIGQFVGRATFDTWLYRMAVNESLQHLRRRKRWKLFSILHEPSSREGGASQREEDKEVLDRALEMLEPELRSIFLLREVERLSYREIAESMEIPEGTVGSRLNRARSELRENLTSLGWEPSDEMS